MHAILGDVPKAPQYSFDGRGINIYAANNHHVVHPPEDAPLQREFVATAETGRRVGCQVTTAELHQIAGPHVLALSPGTWTRRDGLRIKQGDAPWGEVARMPAGRPGIVLETREYYTGDGTLDFTVDASSDGISGAREIGALEVVDVVTDEVVGRAPLSFPSGQVGWQRIPARLDVKGVGDHGVRFRVTATGEAGFEVGTMNLPVDYGFEVVDLTDRLNTFDTHASIFDAHPNKRAHAVMAQVVFEALQSRPADPEK